MFKSVKFAGGFIVVFQRTVTSPLLVIELIVADGPARKSSLVLFLI
jgi:hypothetical protein